MSFSCSESCRRNRASSVRSADVRGCSPDAVAASIRRRSSATQRPSGPSLMPNSRATSATMRPESITRRAASTLHSVVNDLRSRDMRTSFQRNPRSRYLGVHHPGEPLGVGKYDRRASDLQIWVRDECAAHRSARGQEDSALGRAGTARGACRVSDAFRHGRRPRRAPHRPAIEGGWSTMACRQWTCPTHQPAVSSIRR